MKLKLSIKDRLIFSKLYPKKGNIIEQTIVKDISDKVSFKQEDFKKYGIEVIDDMGNMKWDSKEEFEIDFSEAEIKILKKQIEELNKKEEITQNILSLCVLIKEAKEYENKK